MNQLKNPYSSFHDRFLSLLSNCSSLSHAKQLQSHLLVRGHGKTQLFTFKVLRFCFTVLNDIRYARLIFNGVTSPNIYLYTAMITAYSSNCDPVPALTIFSRMLHPDQPKPNEFVFPHVLKCCGDTKDVGLVGSVDSLAQKWGIGRFDVVKSALVDAYSRCGEIRIARQLFDGLGERNVVSWTTMVSAYMRVGLMSSAVSLFDEMPERDVPSWNAVIAGYTQNGFFTEAVDFFRKMVLVGTVPNQTTVACLLSTCGHLGMLQIGKSVHGYMYKHWISSNSFVSNALLDMYGKCGRLREAKSIFDTLSDGSLTAWNSMINCLALHGRSVEAIRAFESMLASGTRPDEVTYVGLMNACTHGGLVDEGRKYFDSMVREYGIEPRIEHYGCIIDLLSRAGRFSEAVDVIRKMKVEPDELVWGSLLNGCRIHKNTSLGGLAVQKLLEIDPDSIDYQVMLANLYSECGKWEEVGYVRKIMSESGKKKLPGCSWIEAEGEIHQFYSGDKTHPQAEEMYDVLEGLALVL